MSKRSTAIVCAIDQSEIAPLVVEHGLSEAYRHKSVALHFLTVVEGKGPKPAALESADTALRSLVAEILPAFADDRAGYERKLRFHVRPGEAQVEIVELAYEAKAERIIVGRHSGILHRKMPGGITAAVVNTAPCTVHVVQVTDYDHPEHDYDQCPTCVQIREDSAGNQWFCSEHNEGRIPRMSEHLGLGSPPPGWSGMF